MPDVLLDSVWPGLLAWAALYCSDYALTVACARLYEAGARDKILFEGSYEITPYFQSDINALRLVSPRFLAALVASSAWLAVIWWLSGQVWRPLWTLALGAVISLELAVHIRHLRNLLLFRALVRTDAVRGCIQYPRPLMLRLSSFEMLAFSAAFAVVSLFSGSLFILGGAMACLSLGAQHWRLARACLPAKPSSAEMRQTAG
jgi:hypothetical protein